MKPDKREVGKMGEDIACKYLKKHGFSIIERNYRKKWGEIDIVSDKDGVLHFVEVKSVTRKKANPSLSGETAKFDDDYLAEENVHPWKLKRLSRAIQTYLLERKIDEEKEWQLDVITVELDFQTRNARVKMLEDVGL